MRRERGGNGRGGSKWIRVERRLAIYHRDNFRCVYCGASTPLSLDHVVPRSHGGGNESANLVTACVSCNASRQHRIIDAEVWDRVRAAQQRPVDLEWGKALRVLMRGTFSVVGTRSGPAKEQQWDITTEQK